MADERLLRASLVIPTHNRCALLRRVLDALADQDCTQPFEVIVVRDGCVDETAAMLAGYRAPYRLLSVATDGAGPAGARNFGAAAAQAPLLIFLDDDVIPTQEFLSAHLAAHKDAAGSVVLGPYPPAPNASRSLFRLRARHWWTDHFARIGLSGHRFSYRDLLTGNLSLSADLWRKVGGLDTRFRHAREDYELGIRLMEMSVRFVFAPIALGYHHEHLTMSLAGSFRRAMEEGRSDVRIAIKHPHVAAGLRVTLLRKRSRRLQRLVDRALFFMKRRLDRPAAIGARILVLLERHGFRSAFLSLYSALNRYWYLRGAAHELGSFSAWRKLADAPAPPRGASDFTIDLSNGFDAAAETLDTLRPRGARLVYGPHFVGILPDEPGAERCRGEHLGPFLVERCGPRLLQALAIEGRLVPSCDTDIGRLAKTVKAAGAFYGPPRSADMWQEQYGQWRRLDTRRQTADPPPAPVDRPLSTDGTSHSSEDGAGT